MPVQTKYLSIAELTVLLNPPGKLGLPDRSLIDRVVVTEGADFTGEESLSVYIVLASDAPHDERIGPLLWPVKDKINDVIRSSGETRFPYLMVRSLDPHGQPSSGGGVGHG